MLVYLKLFLLISMVHQSSAAKTLINKMGLDTFFCCLTYLIIAGLHYSEFAFHCFNTF